MNTDFWRGKRVLLTGHTGFKGGWLSLWLARMGAEVTGFSLPAPTEPSLFDVARVGQQVRSVIGDIRDLEALTRVTQETRPEIVFHLAAQPLVRLSYDDPVGTFASNVMGTVHLCEAVRRVPGVKALLCITSDKCYANQEWEWAYRENDPMGGHDPYSASKGCSELVAASYRDAFFDPAHYSRHGVAMATGRAGNVIGGGDWAADRLIPDLLRGLSSGQETHIRNPGATRPWQHVLEALAGYLVLAERLHTDGTAFNGGWNFGPYESDIQPVRWIVEHMASRLPLKVRMETAADQPHEASSLRLDSAKARRHLGWRPQWSLPQALERIIDWHLAYQGGADMAAFCQQQLTDYMSAPQEIAA